MRKRGAISYRNLQSEAHRKGELEPVVVGPLAKAKMFDVGSPVYTQLLTARELRDRLGK